MKLSILISFLLLSLPGLSHASFVARDIATLVDDAQVAGIFKILSAKVTEYDYQGEIRGCGLIVAGRLIDALKGDVAEYKFGATTEFEVGNLYFLTLWPGKGKWPSHMEVTIVDRNGNKIIDKGQDNCKSSLPSLSEAWIYTGKIHQEPTKHDKWVYWLEQPYAIQTPELKSDIIIDEPSSLSVNGKVIDNRYEWFEKREFPLPRYYWDDTGYFKWSEVREYVEQHRARNSVNKALHRTSR